MFVKCECNSVIRVGGHDTTRLRIYVYKVLRGTTENKAQHKSVCLSGPALIFRIV